MGQFVHKKTATALALVDVKPEDKQALAALVSAVKANYNDKYEEVRKTWGGGVKGFKSQQNEIKQEKARAKAALQVKKA